MATRKTSAAAARVATTAGRALGTIAGKFDAVKARHPNPAAEAGLAVGKGEAKVRKIATEARSRAKAVSATTRAVVKQVKKTGGARVPALKR